MIASINYTQDIGINRDKMKIPKEFEDSPFEYIEYLEQENKELEKRIQKEGLINLTNAEDYHATRKENEELRELLQYVANEHLCGSWLIEEMKKQGVEYNESLKQKKEIRGDSRFR
jgi:predicted nuclease with TOPRIM domain